MAPSREDAALPSGFSLQKGESIVRTASDWGLAGHALTLTTQRLFCPADPSGKRGQVSVPLTEVTNVVFQKHFVGYSTVAIETLSGPKYLVPAHINGRLIRDDILGMVRAARGEPAPGPSRGAAPKTPDRYDQLRKLAELKASGTISDTEFEQEKARILRSP
jgi:hypothetical protein